MDVDVEGLIYRKGFLRKTVSREGYEEAIRTIHSISLDKVLDVLLDSIQNRKLFVLLAVSEAALRKPILRYRLALELLEKGKTDYIDVLGVDKEVIQFIQSSKLSLNEDTLESIYECKRFGLRENLGDVKTCRERYIYSLLGTKNMSVELLSTLLPLATAPSYIDVQAFDHDKNVCVSSWPYTACLNLQKGKTSWYLLGSLLTEDDMDIPKEVSGIKTFAINESAVFIASRAGLEELVIFSSPYRKTRYIKCLKACYDGVGRVYILRPGGNKLSLAILDDKGIEVYERVLDVSLKDVEVASCKSLYGGGAVFSIVKPNQTVFVVAKENKVKDVLIVDKVYTFITMPLNIVLGFSRKNILVLWVDLKDDQIEVFEDKIEVMVPSEDVVAIPGLGIASVTNDGLTLVNALGTTLTSVKLWSRKPREVGTLQLPTFTLLFTKGDDGYIDKIVIVKENGLRDVKPPLLKIYRVKDILYGNNTICFVSETNTISCFSPIYLKTTVEIDNQPSVKPKNVQEVLKLYRATKTNSELALLIEAISNTINTKHLEKLLYKLGIIYRDIKERIDVFRLDAENLINRSIEMDIPIDWIELALSEYLEKAMRWSEAERIALTRISDILGYTQRGVAIYVNLDALISVGNALSLLTNRDYLANLSLDRLIELLEKALSSLEVLGIEATPKTLTKVLPKECINIISIKMLNLIKQRIKDVHHYLVKSYLTDFGLDVELTGDRLEDIAKLLKDLDLEQYLKSLETKISRSVLEKGIESLDKLLTTVISVLRRSRDLIEKQPSMFRTDFKEEVIELLRLYLSNKIDEKTCLEELHRIEVCYQELSIYYQEALTITSRYEILSSVNIDTHISKEYTCGRKVESLKNLISKLRRLSGLIGEMDLLLREFEKYPIVPKNIESTKNIIRDSISSLDVVKASKEIDKLKRYLDKTRSFNEAFRKLKQLIEIPFFADAKHLLSVLAEEFTEIDLDKRDPESLKKIARIERLIADTKRLNIDYIVNYIKGLEEKVKVLRIDVQIFVNSLAGKFLEKLLNEGLDYSINYLSQVENYLTQLQDLIDRRDREINNLKTQLLHIGVESQAIDNIIQHEKDSFPKNISTPTIDDVLKMLGSYINIVENKIGILQELNHDVRLLSNQLNSFEQEIIGAIQRLFLSTDTILANPTFGLLKEYVNRLSLLIEEKSLWEINNLLRMLKNSKNDLKSELAISLLNKVIEVSIESMVKNSFSPQSIQEAKQLLGYGIKRVYSDMKHLYLDNILSFLEKTGLNLAKFIEFSTENFVDVINAFIEKLKKLDEVKEFTYTCPDVVAKLIEVNKDIDSRVIYSLKFAEELGQSVENICNIYRKEQFNSIEEGILWVLASIGEKDSRFRVHSKLDKLSLAYSTFMAYFSRQASRHVECRELVQEFGILSRIYREYCENNNVEKALAYSILACAEAKYSFDCGIAVGLLGGFYVKQLINYIDDISMTLNINMDDSSLKRYIINSLLKVIDEKGGIKIGYLQELVKSHENIYKELKSFKEAVEGFNRIRDRVGGDVSKLIQAINLIIDSIHKPNILDEEKVDLVIYGEIEEGRESTLTIEVCNKMDITPLNVKELTLNFTDIGYRYPQQVSLSIEPMNCRSVLTTIPRRLFDPAKLALGKEVGLNIEFRYALPITTKEMHYSIATFVPVKYYGKRGDLIETIEDVASRLRGWISVDTTRLHDTLIAVGGNNIVILGQLEDDRSRVVIKIPVFYKDIASITIDRNLIKRCEELANKCREATQRCSKTTSIVEILDVSLVPPYAVERYIIGESLRKLIRDRGRLTLLEAIEIAIRVGEGVKCLHSQDIYHNDIRPENVIVKMVGEKIVDVYLIDSCIDNVWREYRSSLGTRDMRTSTIGNEIDERYHHSNLESMLKKAEKEKNLKKMLEVYKDIDTFQLGVLLTEMLLGYNPVPMIKKTENVGSILPSVIPAELSNLLGKILTPSETYITLDEFLSCLKRVKSDIVGRY